MALAPQEAVIRLKVDPGNTQQATEQVARGLERVGRAGETSARTAVTAMRRLPGSFAHIASAIASNDSPLLAIATQGGLAALRIGDVAGGASSLLAGLGPLAAAAGTAAAAIGSIGIAAFQGAKEQKDLENALTLTGNAAGVTAGRLREVSERVSDSSQKTVGSARDIATELVKSGMISGKALESTATAVARVSDVSGESAKTVAADFAKMAGGVADWAAEHNKAWNFLSVEQYKYIKRLEDQGEAEKAAIAVNKLIVDRLEIQKLRVGTLESAYESLLKKASAFWEYLKSIGRSDVETKLQDRLDQLNGRPANMWDPRARAAILRDIKALSQAQQYAADAATAASERASENRAEIAEERKREQERKRSGGGARADYFNRAQDQLEEHIRQKLALIERSDIEAEDKFGAIRDPLGQYKQDFLRSEKAAYAQMSEEVASTLHDDVSAALLAAFRDSKNPARAFAEALGSIVYARLTASIADALATAAVGKDGKGGILGDIVKAGMAFFTPTGSSTAADAVDVRAPIRGARSYAVGTDYVPKDGLAFLHRGERVVPAAQNKAGGAAGPVSITISVDSRTDRAQVAQIAAEASRRGYEEAMAELSRVGVLR